MVSGTIADKKGGGDRNERSDFQEFSSVYLHKYIIIFLTVCIKYHIDASIHKVDAEPIMLKYHDTRYMLNITGLKPHKTGWMRMEITFKHH